MAGGLYSSVHVLHFLHIPQSLVNSVLRCEWCANLKHICGSNTYWWFKFQCKVLQKCVSTRYVNKITGKIKGAIFRSNSGCIAGHRDKKWQVSLSLLPLNGMTSTLTLPVLFKLMRKKIGLKRTPKSWTMKALLFRFSRGRTFGPPH